jgi:hypothetical protein
MNFRSRLQRLERARPPGPTLWLAFVDEAGDILDDGSAEVRPWVGRHWGTVPSIGRIVMGVDQLQVLGRRRGGLA